MLKICKQLFSQWKNNEVRYCHWKSNEHLMEGLDGGTDLDVYVAPSDKEKAETILKQCNYIECQTQKGHRYPNVFEWIGFDPSTGKLIHVHLHYQIITGTKFCKEYVFPIDELIITTRVLDNDTEVYVTDPNLEIIILYCRIALKAIKKHNILIGQSDFREITYLKERIKTDIVHNLCGKLIGKKGEDLYALIMKEKVSCEDWNNIYLIAEGWLKPYRKYSKLHVFFRNRYYLFRKRIIRVAENKSRYHAIDQKTFPKSNLSICFIGQDGSGKSTVTMELCKWLNWKIEAMRFYLGSGEHYTSTTNNLIKKLSRIKHRNAQQLQGTPKKRVSEAPKKQKKNLKNYTPAVISAYKKLEVARNAYKEVRRAESYKKRGGIPFFDRFPQLQFEGIYDGPKIADSYKKNGLDYAIIKWMAKKEYRYLKRIQDYQPKLIFKLILSPEESIRRKPFENFEVVLRKHEITKELEFPNSIVHTVDATQDFNEELLFIKNQIWKELVSNNA